MKQTIINFINQDEFCHVIYHQEVINKKESKKELKIINLSYLLNEYNKECKETFKYISPFKYSDAIVMIHCKLIELIWHPSFLTENFLRWFIETKKPESILCIEYFFKVEECILSYGYKIQHKINNFTTYSINH